MLDPSTPGMGKNRVGSLSLLLLSVWCGLIAGLLEVSTIVLRKRVFDPDQLYKTSRHFIWMIPLIDLGLFAVLGFVGCCIILIWPRRGQWIFTRGLATITVLPSFLVAFPRIYSLAWLLVVLGLAAQLVPLFETSRRLLRRLAIVTFPFLMAIVACLWASLWIGDRIKQSRENARALPPPKSPNVLLIVLDTVAAGHLSLHGYDRATSPTLLELAERGIRFDTARAASSWTLPSHATMLTGRWMHELSVGWYTPLDRAQSTLAEFLGDHGYATAGFVANTWYCGADSGLSRGFTHYRDFNSPGLTVPKTAALVSRALEAFETVVYYTEDWLESTGLLSYVQRVWRLLAFDRKAAAAVNRELLGWLSQRVQPERPFFAFLNYYDAHTPYQLPPGGIHRFGIEPADNAERVLIQYWAELDKTTISAKGVNFAADAYDDCIGDLDEQIGILIDELIQRGALEQTWLIITSDHGESFGEHAGIYCHGMSLYETEVRVPLIIVPPGGSTTRQTVKEAVSLRDLAATIIDVVGLSARSSFPGKSLARFWNHSPPNVPLEHSSASVALAEVVPHDQRERNYWGLPKPLAPLGAIKEKDWSYIRREGNVHEELFHLSEDTMEQRNLAGDPTARTKLEQMRAVLDDLTGGPLLPERFSP